MLAGNVRLLVLVTILYLASSTVYAQQEVDNSTLYQKAFGSVNSIIKNNNLPVLEIDLDAVPVDTLIPVKIIDSKKDNPNTRYFLSAPLGIIAIRDTLLILDKDQHTIFVSDFNGNLKGMIGRKGAGPGEFNTPFYLASNGKYYAVYDHWNGRVQFLNRKFKYVKSVIGQYHPWGGNIAISKDYLFQNSPYRKFPKRVETNSLKNDVFKKTEFIDSKFNFENDLKVANCIYDMRFCVIKDNRVFTLGGCLPFAFCFDNMGKPEYAIKFTGKFVNQLAKFLERAKVSNGGVNLQGFSHEIMSNGEYVIFSIYNKLFVFSLTKKKMVQAYKFNESFLTQGTIYKSAIFYITGADVFKVQIPLLND